MSIRWGDKRLQNWGVGGKLGPTRTKDSTFHLRRVVQEAVATAKKSSELRVPERTAWGYAARSPPPSRSPLLPPLLPPYRSLPPPTVSAADEAPLMIWGGWGK